MSLSQHSSLHVNVRVHVRPQELVLLPREMVLPSRELVLLPRGMVLLLPETARVQFHWQDRPCSKQSRQQECWYRMWMLRSQRQPLSYRRPCRCRRSPECLRWLSTWLLRIAHHHPHNRRFLDSRMLCRHLMVGLLSSVLQYRMRWYSRWLRQQDPVHSSQEQLWRLSRALQCT